MRFTVERIGDELVATTDDPRLRGVTWWWSGTGAVDYGLAGGDPVGMLNVWDYEAGAPSIEFTAEALAARLESSYSDPAEVEATSETIARA